MNIAIVGYGKMGKEIELAAIERGHSISCIVRNANDPLCDADVAIEFTNPQSCLDNFQKIFRKNMPVITGSTGWYDQMKEVQSQVLDENLSFLYASNFSIGVNLFFKLNQRLAQLMQDHPDYDCFVKEIHHTEKKDAPSGTAITIANDIISNSSKTGWVNHESISQEDLSIFSERLDNVPGTHRIQYSNEIDEIEITHSAKGRKGFAKGAIQAAEWLVNKKGFYSIQDMLKL